MFVPIPPRRKIGLRWVTPVLSALLVLGFVWTQALPAAVREGVLLDWGTLGVRWGSMRMLAPVDALKPFTALFLHESWSHLIGNLVFLLIFGLPAERMMGSRRFLALFLVGGAASNVAAALGIGDNQVLIGASGAVSAVIGAWLVLFPGAKLGVVLPLGLFLEFVRAPAILLIGIWVALQAMFAYIGPAFGQVAWLAHLAGFAMGGIFALLSRNAIAKRLRRQRGY